MPWCWCISSLQSLLISCAQSQLWSNSISEIIFKQHSWAMDVMVFLQSPGGRYCYFPIRAKLIDVLLSWWHRYSVQQFVLGKKCQQVPDHPIILPIWQGHESLWDLSPIFWIHVLCSWLGVVPGPINIMWIGIISQEFWDNSRFLYRLYYVNEHELA